MKRDLAPVIFCRSHDIGGIDVERVETGEALVSSVCVVLKRDLDFIPAIKGHELVLLLEAGGQCIVCADVIGNVLGDVAHRGGHHFGEHRAGSSHW